MKKSKILMPLTGIAAIGAFAPVIAMSSCNKNEYKLFEKYKFQYDGLVGADLIEGKTELTLDIYTKILKTPTVGHTFWHSWEAQSSKSGKIRLGTQAEAPIEAQTPYETEPLIYEGAFSFIIDKAITLKEDETFTFNVKYTEKDASNNVVGSQITTYSVTLFAEKISLPELSLGEFKGTEETAGKEFKLTGLTLDANALADITVTLQNTETTLTSANEDKLAIAKTTTIEKATKNLDLNGTLTMKKRAAGSVTFKVEEAIKLQFVEKTGKYVKDTWTVEIDEEELSGKETITVIAVA